MVGTRKMFSNVPETPDSLKRELDKLKPSVTEQVIAQATQGGIKHDHGKPAIHLIDHDFLAACVDTSKVHAPSLDNIRENIHQHHWLHIYQVLEAAIGGQHVMHNEIAHVLAMGAAKYGVNNWRGGMKWSRVARALLEHVRQFSEHGQLRDPESGYHHIGHAACCVMFLWWYTKHDVGEDDLDEVMFPTAGPTEDALTLPFYGTCDECGREGYSMNGHAQPNPNVCPQCPRSPTDEEFATVDGTGG